MSFKAAAWAIQQKPELPVEKLILIGLSDCYNNDTHRCDPSIITLAEIGLCCKRTAIRAIKSLETQGFIATVKTTGKRTKYELCFDRGDNLSPVTESHHTSDTHVTTPVTPMSPEPVSNLEETSNTSLAASTANCPHEKIIDLYHTNCPTLSRVKMWTDKRKKHLQARWRESEKHQTLDFWDRYFKHVSRSDFLSGRTTDWKCNLEWLVNSTNFVKVIENNYVNR